MRRLVVALLAFGLLVGALPRADAAQVLEKHVNLDESLRLAAILRAEGHEVLLTRDRDVFISLEQRSAISNNWRPDVFVSVHNNASSNASVSGTEIWTQVGLARGAKVGQSVHDGIVTRAGTRARGVKQRVNSSGGDYYAVLRNTRALAMIVEGEFLSNPTGARNLADPAFRQRVALGIADGLRTQVAATPKPTGPGPGAPVRPVLDPPKGLRAWKASAGRVGVEWQTATGVTRYRLWRDGILIRDLAVDPTAAPRTIGLAEDQPVGLHRYQVRAYTEAAGRLVTDSNVSTAQVLLGWRVVIDAGHGGNDPGAAGAI